jgi:acyl-CoA thioester hydrolase
MSELLKEFPLVIDIVVAWGDMDAMQHVNNTKYFLYFESARIAYYEKLNVWQMMKSTGIGPILASTECKFKIPLTYPDTVSVGARVQNIEEDRFLMEYCLVSHRFGKIAAQGSGLTVTFNYAEQKKVPVPKELRESILQFESTVKK